MTKNAVVIKGKHLPDETIENCEYCNYYRRTLLRYISNYFGLSYCGKCGCIIDGYNVFRGSFALNSGSWVVEYPIPDWCPILKRGGDNQ